MATKKAAPKKSPKLTAAVASPKINRAEEARWRARDDLRVLQQAQEIQRDRSRLSMAKREAQAQISALAKVSK
jgi:hypothetical protein